jgi:hypothetical protein
MNKNSEKSIPLKNSENGHSEVGPDLFCRKIISTKIFDQTPFNRNSIRPKIHWTESPFSRTPIDRKSILPKKVI